MHVVIIGNGIAGITAARTIRKGSDFRITVISSESRYFFSRTALMYIYMGHMKHEHVKPYEDNFWEENRIELVYDHVTSVDFGQKQLSLKTGTSLPYDKLLLATGSTYNTFNWPGQDLKGVQGLYGLPDLELLEKNTHPPHTPLSKMRVKHAVIVGGGLIGVELVEMLMTRKIKVTFLVRESQFWGSVLPKEESELVMRHLKIHGVEMKMSTELKEIQGDSDGRVKSVVTKSGEVIDCEFVGLTVGVSPNVKFLADSTLELNRGILVDETLRTNIPDVFAAGDCAEFKLPPSGRQKIEQVWYTGRMMGETAGKNILGESLKYEPGPWFNSAKFFDIEYQTYGKVSKSLVDGEEQFYWENAEGTKCLKLVSGLDGMLIGVNVFGIRLRHEILDRWLRSEKSSAYFVEHLQDALFDQEFSKDFSSEIISKFNAETGSKISLQKKSWKRILQSL